MCLLEKVDRQTKHLVVGKRDVIFQNRQLVVPVGRFQSQCRLDPAHDVVGDFERGLVVVHSHGAAKVSMCLDRDAGDD